MTVPKWQSSNWLSNHRFLFRIRAIFRRGLRCLRRDFFLAALAEAGYFLQSATLISNFSTAKRLHSKERKQKPFAAQTTPRKRGYFSTHQTIVGKNFSYLRNFLSSFANAPHCSIMGFVQTQTISEKVLLFIYSNSQQDSFFRPARYREMTLLNYSFMFGRCEVNIRFCFAGTK